MLQDTVVVPAAAVSAPASAKTWHTLVGPGIIAIGGIGTVAWMGSCSGWYPKQSAGCLGNRPMFAA
jgi:hypothetical protein